MRDIKFRAWDGSKMITNDYPFIGAGSGALELTITLNGEVQKRSVYGFDSATGTPTSEPDIILMRYTGKQDVTGKEIFEGDILDWETKEAKEDGVVRWIDGGFWLKYSGGHHFPYNTTVIGNIYENAEPLTEKV